MPSVTNCVAHFPKLAWCALIAAALLPASASAQFAENVAAPPENLKAGFDSITAAQSKKWLNVLAGPGFEGRGTGQVGYSKAAHWVAGKAAEFGLEPIGNNGTYFQMLPMKRRQLLLDECFLSGPDDLKIKAKGNLGFERYTDRQESTGEAVFVRFAKGSSDLPEASLRDKIVFYVAEDNNRRATFTIARQRPMAAIRVIETEPKSISQLVRKGGRRRNTSISGTITKEAAKKLAKSLGGEDSWVDGPGNKASFHASEKNVTLRLRYREEPAAVPNVVAWLEGSDPKLKDEYVVIGSHLDHLGIRGGQIFPGADDNGSGSTAVLNIAKAMALNPVKPKRSVLFIWFAAEEIGLVGSRHYVNNPTKPVDKMICMFNIDMVGRNEEKGSETAAENEGSIHLVGSQKGSTDIHKLVLEANKHVGFRFELDEEGVFGRSDQINFYRKGVPVAFLFGGFHPDYHQPTDKPEAINFKKIASAARLYYMAIHLASEHGPFKLKTKKSD